MVLVRNFYRRTLYFYFRYLEKRALWIIGAFLEFFKKGTTWKFLGYPPRFVDLDHRKRQVVYPEKRITLRPPMTIQTPCTAFNPAFLAHGGFLASLDQGIATGSGIHLTEEGYLVSEISQHYELRDLFDYKLFKFRCNRTSPQALLIDDAVVSLATDKASNYAHWLFDILPRWGIVQKLGIDPAYYYLPIDREKEPYKEESLKLFGFPLEKIVNGYTFPILQAKQLYVPAFLGFPRQITCSEWSMQFIRSLIQPLKNRLYCSHSPKKIYISRQDASRRKCLNEVELIYHLQQQGFSIIQLSGKSLIEQMRLFYNAQMVIGPHGAGMMNTLFCQPGTRVIELYPPNWLKVMYYWPLAHFCQLDYYYLVGTPCTSSKLQNVEENFLINPDEFIRIMAIAGLNV